MAAPPAHNPADNAPKSQAGAAAGALLAELRQQIYRAHGRQIRAMLAPPSAALQAYARRYRRATATAQRTIALAKMVAALAPADVVLLGDYHPLGAARAWALRLCRALRRQGPLCLGLEYFRRGDNAALRAFVAGRLAGSCLRRVTHKTGTPAPGAASWASFWPLLTWARAHAIPVVGLDSTGRGADSLAMRDATAARVLQQACAKHGRVVALVGQMHLAPGHLPRALRAAFAAAAAAAADGTPARPAPRPRRFTVGAPRPAPLPATPARPTVGVVYQNCERLWFVHRPPAAGASVLQLGALRFALQHTSPITAQQAYLAQLTGLGRGEGRQRRGTGHGYGHGYGEDAARPPQPAVVFRQTVRLLARRLGLAVPPELATVHVCTGDDVAFLLPLARVVRRDAWQHLRDQLARGQSVFVPRANVVYLGSLSPGVVGEEAAHYLRYCAQGRVPPPPAQSGAELFCHHAFEEALGFVGGALCDPARRAPKATDLRHLAATGSPQERIVAQSTLAHLALQAGRPAADGRGLFTGTLAVRDAAAHLCGYALGQKLVAALRRGPALGVSPRAIGALFAWRHAPLDNYLGLLAWLRALPPRRRTPAHKRRTRGQSHPTGR